MIVFDLDGTLTDDTHRRHHLEKRDWEAYHAVVYYDKPKWPVLSVMRALFNNGEMVQIWSGRSESCRADTARWFWTHASWVMHHEILIRMRPVGDERSSAELKEQWLDEALLGGSRAVTLAIDDLQTAVDMWRRRGILCMQVEVNGRDYNKAD